ncbi:MAG: hypothetical protein QW196_08180, partial [Sulfolobales archaeon]
RIEVAEENGVAREVVVVVAELAQPGEVPGLEDALQRRLKEVLGVTPKVRLERPGALERTAFKAKRVVRHGRALFLGRWGEILRRALKTRLRRLFPAPRQSLEEVDVRT